METGLDAIKKFLDTTFPDVGTDCPNFPVMVVLFSAALLRTANLETLCAFTGYSPEYLGAIAFKMANNQLWVGDHYTGSGWLNDRGFDEDEFGQQVDMAMGTLWHKDAVNVRDSQDVLLFSPSSRN